MADIELSVERRDSQGSAPSRRMRHAGRVPGVVYGHGAAPIAVSVDARDLRHALASKAGANALFNLSIGSERHLAMARELQHHPVRHAISHVDFLIVGRDEVISADVPLEFVGESVSVNHQDGTIEHLVQSVTVKAKPGAIPASIRLDVSDLEIGDSLTIGDLVVPAGVTLEGDPETAVVIAHPPRKVAVEAEGEVAEPAGETA